MNAQCAGCNLQHNLNPEPYRRAFVSKYGQKALMQLEKQYLAPKYFSDMELQEMIIKYKQKLNGME